MKKQTAVEWLIKKLYEYEQQNGNSLTFAQMKPLLEKAKEMEKQQIIDANIAGQMFIGACPSHYKNDAEDYYKGTFNKD